MADCAAGGVADCVVTPHPASPAPAAYWTQQAAITFDRVKLTNQRRAGPGRVCLHSMHRYQVPAPPSLPRGAGAAPAWPMV